VTSWRDSASTQAQQDLDSLLNVALGFAQQQLATRGEFFPYAAAVDTHGEAEMVAARPDAHDEHPRSADVIESCVASLVSQRDYIRAGAIVADVRVPELGGDAIRVDLEHVEGTTLTVVLPYTKKRLRKNVDYGQIRAEPGRRQIWT
jgi:hypothetical protein